MSTSPPELSLSAWRPVAEGVHVLTAQPATVTIGLVVGSAGCLVVDTGSTPEQGRAIRTAVAEITSLPVLGVAVTHAHFDHFYGLAGFDGVTSYGHESLAERLGSDAVRAEAAGLGFDAAELVAPTRQLAVAAALDLGGIRVEMAHLGAGHTAGDLVVSVALDGKPPHVVFAGDLIETAGPPWFGIDSHPLEWAGTLDGVIGLLGPTTVLVPGHGDPVGRDDVFGQRGAIGAVAGELQRLVQTGVAVDQAAERGAWPFPVAQITEAIAPAYAELISQGVRPRPNLPIVNL